jgi:glycosyltransferase involved in cell wall biosynthesis
MSEIKVSIICLAYNHENYISKALDGFLMQKTNFKFEVLIHDDASTDRTADIIREYEAKYPEIIKPIYQAENQYSQNIQILRTYMFPKAKGEYIAFCEGDDFWIDEKKLQEQVDFLDNNKEYSACVHKYITVDKEGKRTYLKTFGDYDKSGRYTLKDLETNELPSQLASLVCRNIFLKSETMYPKSFYNVSVQGDVKFFLYLLAHGDVYRMEGVYSAYRFVQELGGDSWSSKELTNHNTRYKRWRHLKKLERAFYDEYRIKIDLSNRKIPCAKDVVYFLKRNVVFLLEGKTFEV